MNMPKELTHWFLADQARAGLRPDSRLRGIIESHLPAYLGGSVLPDTLLHLFRGEHAADALALAHSFHDATGNSFAPLIHAEGCFPNGFPPALLACLLGVITHIQTDIIFHPFVYAVTGPAGIGRHYQVETAIDCYFLDNGTIPAKRHLADMMSAETRETLITVCALLFDRDGKLPRLALEQALASHCRFQAMYDNIFWKLAVRLLATCIGSPFKEQRHLFYPLSHTSVIGSLGDSSHGWRHPVTGEVHRSSLEDMANEAVRRIMALFTRIESQGSLAAALVNRPGENLLTGLHGIQRSAMDCAAVHR